MQAAGPSGQSVQAHLVPDPRKVQGPTKTNAGCTAPQPDPTQGDSLTARPSAGCAAPQPDPTGAGPHLITEHSEPLLQGELEPVTARHTVAGPVAAGARQRRGGGVRSLVMCQCHPVAVLVAGGLKGGKRTGGTGDAGWLSASDVATSHHAAPTATHWKYSWPTTPSMRL